MLWSTVTAATDALRGCPTRRLANRVSQGAPVWRYLYTHTYENDPFLAQFRASHIFEDPFLWGNFSLFPGFIDGYIPTPAEQILSQRMTDYWTNFAKTGNPNGPGLPTWPQYNSVTEPTLTLDNQIGVINNYHDQQCALLDTITHVFPPPWLNGEGVAPPSPSVASTDTGQPASDPHTPGASRGQLVQPESIRTTTTRAANAAHSTARKYSNAP